ncbi:MAG TPA: glutamate-5-semialdehyde dehydrogenase [Acidimicrobiia bacterium]|nr:glutamate-5-semialdehyde dehydrogenase [Acidimicrobiia bacterium]
MIQAIGEAARAASRRQAMAATHLKNRALERAAAGLEAESERLLDANTGDVEEARAQGIGRALLDRLRLTPARIGGMAGGLRQVAALPDPVGEVTAGFVRPNGLRMTRFRAPLGVVAVIFEARPNVTADAAGLALKAGNAVVLRGSSYALRSNMAVGEILRKAQVEAGLEADAVQVMSDTSREAARALMQAKEWIDLLVPRGGPKLISAIESEATVPYVIDGAGNCHIYVDASADLDLAAEIVVNSKVSRPGVCNSAEKLLVHRSVAADFLPQVTKLLGAAGVELRGDESARSYVDDLLEAVSDDWSTEYLDLVMAVKVIDSVDEAINHVRQFGSGHTEAIVTRDLESADRFVRELDSAVVMVNASTRFTDGEEFGYGAEIGISTQKLHVRGPMGLEALTCERWVVHGSGQIR